MEGAVHPDFASVARALQRVIPPDGSEGGAAVAVYHRGEPVVDIWVGHSDRNGTPWQRDTMAMSFSTTKGVVSTVIHRLVDRGELHWDDPVANVWPEFAAGGKERITVRDLLTHRAGLHSIRTLVEHTDELLDWPHMIDLLAAVRPDRPPHAETGYHAVTFGWLAGEVIRRVTGLTVSQAVERELSQPLGLKSLFIGAPSAERHRAAELLIDDTVKNRLDRFFRLLDRYDNTRPAVDALVVEDFLDLATTGRIHDAEIPAANGVFTARDLAKMYSALASPGTLGGEPFLSAKTLAEATRIQTHGRDAVLFADVRWRLGYHAIPTFAGVPPRAFGHLGFGGSGAWGDQDTGLGVAMVLNKLSGTLLGDTRFLRVGGAALRSARSRPT
ncbi:MAG: beta-lactamase family protein [Acidimicrobiales bacterium]|nr:beta-lactamase family protein [Acidimicrobiales bacterium]